jgi:hypothetical protein
LVSASTDAALRAPLAISWTMAAADPITGETPAPLPMQTAAAIA